MTGRGLLALTVAAAIGVGTPDAVAGWPAGQAQAAEAEALSRAARLERSGRLAEARHALREVLRGNPTHLTGLAALLRVTAALGEPESALPQVEAAVQRAGRVPAVRGLWVRALAAAGLRDSAVAVARWWTAETPGESTAWAELAGALRVAGDASGAITALREGRERTGDAALFAQELAELYVEAGDLPGAAREWVTILTWGEAGVSAVAGRLRALEGAREPALQALWAHLSSERTPPAAARGGLELAHLLGERERGRALLEAFVSRLPRDSGLPLLREQALRAREAGWWKMARWASGELASRVTDPGERRRWRGLAAEAALVVGDTTEAREALEALVREAPPGSEAHRFALRRLYSVYLAEAPGPAETLLEAFAEHYGSEGGGLEPARMAVDLSRRHVRRGDLRAAERVLALAPPPSDAAAAAELEGQAGRILLYRGRPAEAAGRLETAAWIPTREAGARTEAIALLDAVSRADSAEAVALGRLLYRLEREPAREDDGERVLEAWDRLPPSEARPALLALAAERLEGSGSPAAAAAVRRVLVDRHPYAPQVPAALLGLARATSGEDREAARRWLERLIVDHPQSALTPVARRLLEELQGRVPSS